MKFQAYLIALCILIISSCAQVVNPTGGAKDTQAPEVVEIKPANKSTNVKDKRIVMRFAENIELKEAQKQIIVSPSLSQQPQYKVKGKQLFIELPDSLNENTSYTLNFGSAIADVNEGNITPNLTYTFSTGDKLDSLTINGRLIDAITQLPVKDAWVMLFYESNKEKRFKKTPEYLTRSKSNGAFSFTQLPNKSFWVIALKEENGNYQLDQEKEQIGFIDTPIVAGDTLVHTIKVFKNEAPKLNVKKYQADANGGVEIITTKPIQTPRLKLLGAKWLNFKPLLELKTKPSDTLWAWLPGVQGDSVQLQLSDGETIIDTLMLRLQSNEKRMLGKTLNANKPVIQFLPTKGRLDIGQLPIVKASLPITIINQQKIQLRIDSVSQPLADTTLYPSITKTHPLNLMLATNQWFKPNLQEKKYHYTLFPGAITTVNGQVNDTIVAEFELAKEDYYGTLNITLQNENLLNPSDLILLMNEKGAILQEQTIGQQRAFMYTLLKPGNYTMRIVRDTNANMRWDTGSFENNKQPEEIINYPGFLLIRSNWDLEQVWKLTP